MSITTTTRTPGDTSKSKKSLAAKLDMSLAKLETLSIAWVPMPLNADQKALIGAVSQARSTDDKDVPTWKVLHDLMSKALADATPALEKEAAAILAKKAEGETEEELEKEAAAMARKMEKITQMLNLKREAAKAAQAAAQKTTPKK